MNSREFNKIISEHFDIFDTDTRRALLNLNEADQNAVLSSLSAKLYHIIVDKSTEIDYGDIPKSKGDITLIPNFVNITECLDTIGGLLTEFKESTEPVDEIKKCINNLRNSKQMWMKAYTYNARVAIVLYETMALAIVSSTSLLISTSIEYIKEPSEQTYSVTLDTVGYKKTKNALLFRDLKKFNKAYQNGEIKKTVEAMLKVRDNVKEAADIVNEFSATAVIAGVVTAGMVVSMISLIIPLLQDLVCLFFCAKQKLSDYFDIQANLLALNAETVKLDYTKTEAKREQIYKKQMKLVERFKKISNKLAVRLKSAETQGTAMAKKEASTKYKMDDVITDGQMSSSSMF